MKKSPEVSRQTLIAHQAETLVTAATEVIILYTGSSHMHVVLHTFTVACSTDTHLHTQINMREC